MILLKLMTGFTLGAVAGVLLAPQRGAETRQQLARGTAKLRSKAKEVASSIRESDTPRRLMEGGARVGKGVAGMASSVGQQVGRTLGNTRQEMSADTNGGSEWEVLAEDYDSLRRELEKQSGKSKGGSLTWILMGGLLGVAIGILMAPKPGRETREELARKAKQLRLQSEETAARF